MIDSDNNIKLSQAYIKTLMDGIHSEIQSIDKLVQEISNNIISLNTAERYKPDKQDLTIVLKDLEGILILKINEVNKTLIDVENKLGLNTSSDESHHKNVLVLIKDIKKLIDDFDKRMWKFLALCGVGFLVFMFLMGLIQAHVIKLG